MSRVCRLSSDVIPARSRRDLKQSCQPVRDYGSLVQNLSWFYARAGCRSAKFETYIQRSYTRARGLEQRAAPNTFVISLYLYTFRPKYHSPCFKRLLIESTVKLPGPVAHRGFLSVLHRIGVNSGSSIYTDSRASEGRWNFPSA